MLVFIIYIYRNYPRQCSLALQVMVIVFDDMIT